MFTGMMTIGLGAQFMSLGAANCTLTGMILGHFVIGTGVAMLERSANAYAVNCGPRRQAPLRILVAQSVAGVGTVLAPLIANVFILSPDSSDVLPSPDPLQPGKCLAHAAKTGACEALGSVITFYRALGGIVFGVAGLLGVVYFRTWAVPEVEVPESPKTECQWKIWQHPLASVKYARMWWGVAANFINLGCQVTLAQVSSSTHPKIVPC